MPPAALSCLFLTTAPLQLAHVDDNLRTRHSATRHGHLTKHGSPGISQVSRGAREGWAESCPSPGLSLRVATMPPGVTVELGAPGPRSAGQAGYRGSGRGFAGSDYPSSERGTPQQSIAHAYCQAQAWSEGQAPRSLCMTSPGSSLLGSAGPPSPAPRGCTRHLGKSHCLGQKVEGRRWWLLATMNFSF